MNNYIREQIEELIKRWGVPLQYIMTMEQCNQLAVEVSHEFRHGGNREKIIERIADMEIMIETLKIILNISYLDVYRYTHEKIQKGLKVDGWQKVDEEALMELLKDEK